MSEQVLNQELEQDLNEKIRISNVLEPTTENHTPDLLHIKRYNYIKSLIGNEIYKVRPDILKMAIDGAYRFTPEQANKFDEFAELVAMYNPILNRLGRGTKFYKAVQYFN